MRKIRIVNIPKFITSIIIMLGIILGVLTILSNVTLSHGEVNYDRTYVSAGDTLWSIAEAEMETNKYYEEKDIRYIVNDLKKINHLETSSLVIGQELAIPKI